MVESERAQWEMEKTQLRMQLNKDTSLTGSLKVCLETGREIVVNESNVGCARKRGGGGDNI